MAQSIDVQRGEGGSCMHQIIGRVKHHDVIGGPPLVSQSVLCKLKCFFHPDGSLIPTLGTGCQYRGQEKACPNFQEGATTDLND